MSFSAARCHIGRTVTQFACSQTEPLETTHHERVVVHRGRIVEHGGQLCMIFVRGALEARADHVITRIVVFPPRTFEIEHGGVAFGQHHPTDWPEVDANYKHGSNKFDDPIWRRTVVVG